MKIKITVSTNKVGSEDYSIIEIDEEDILCMSAKEAENYINEIAIDEIISNGLIDGLIDWSWSIIV